MKSNSIQSKKEFHLLIIQKLPLLLISILIRHIIFFILYTDCKSNITLVIKGKGNQSLLYSGFSYTPSDVIIDGISKKGECNKTCELDKNETEIKLVFDSQINNCSKMFYDLVNITEIDLSDLMLQKLLVCNICFIIVLI